MDVQEHSATPRELSQLPTQPGVYLLKGRRHEGERVSILYIGKAKNLRARVRQYFVGEGDGRPFAKFIQSKVELIHTIVVESEQDALLLENELIKKHRPAYNISLKDDKRFLSLRLDTNVEWPRIDIVRKIKRDKAIYLGPFSSSTRLRSTLEFMQKVFPLRTCDDRKLYNRSRPCLEYEIKRCVAPCVGYVTHEVYGALVQSAILFLRGENQELVKRLTVAMSSAAEAEDFEKAAILRDRIQAIEQTVQAQGVIGIQQWQQNLDQDVLGICMDRQRAVIVILFVRAGVIFDKRSFEFKDVELDAMSLLSEFAERYYSTGVYWPHEILVPSPIELSQEGLRFVVPRSEEKRRFVELARQNAQANLEALFVRTEKMEMTLTVLQRQLGLSKVPTTIDCLDVSHHQGAETVASVVRFREGRPDKSRYRKMRLRAERIDDFESMKEVVSRAYRSADDLPSLIVVDGGRGQLSAALQALEEAALREHVEIVSLAKARDREGIDPLNPQNRERVFKPDQKNPVLLKQDSAEELLLRYLRDEAHRFAIAYHRDRKNDSLSISVLDAVPGISEKTKIKLLKEFGSVDGIMAANDEALKRVVSEKVLAALRLTLKRACEEDT